MSERERFLAAMRRRQEGHVPKRIDLCPAQRERFLKEYGHEDVAAQWRAPVRRVDLPFVPRCEDFSPWHGAPAAGVSIDEWGIGHAATAESFHFTRLVHPLANATTVAEVERYPLPTVPDKAGVAQVAARVAALHAEGRPVQIATNPVGGTVFWPAYKLRGMEALLCDMADNPPLAQALLERVTELTTRHAALAASTGADVLHLADDFGTQQSTYVSPAAFRRWFKPLLRRVIAAAKQANPDILVHFHSDGAVQTLIPDLIDIGVDILNPVQPECMDPFEVKRQYGRDLSFSGCVGTQTTMPFGTPDTVRGVVQRLCEQMGKGGGLWIGPTHLIEPEVPWENILAFVETADIYS